MKKFFNRAMHVRIWDWIARNVEKTNNPWALKELAFAMYGVPEESRNRIKHLCYGCDVKSARHFCLSGCPIGELDCTVEDSIFDAFLCAMIYKDVAEARRLAILIRDAEVNEGWETN